MQASFPHQPQQTDIIAVSCKQASPTKNLFGSHTTRDPKANTAQQRGAVNEAVYQFKEQAEVNCGDYNSRAFAKHRQGARHYMGKAYLSTGKTKDPKKNISDREYIQSLVERKMKDKSCLALDTIWATFSCNVTIGVIMTPRSFNLNAFFRDVPLSSCTAAILFVADDVTMDSDYGPSNQPSSAPHFFKEDIKP
ncbi:hypothetical protein J6590_025450 [Homalodisca vitripennis]|nr:hypothetical protein J6590_025450 [Homalodisca vitripennis]